MKKSIPVMFCFDTNYVIPAAIAFYSLLENSSKDYFYDFYVLHCDITKKQQDKLNETLNSFKNCKLTFINMNGKFDDFWQKNYRGNHFSKEVMYKLLVASIFPKLDKIVVSDVDVAFLGDISNSYTLLNADSDYYLAGIKPIGKVAPFLKSYEKEWTQEEIGKLGNLCGGYLVMNLKQIRKQNVEDKFIKCLNENGPRLIQMEQDILNLVCYNKIQYLPLKYLACSYMWDYFKEDIDFLTDINYESTEIYDAMNNPVQLHYATGIKPWNEFDCTKSEIWFKYLLKTPFYDEFIMSLPQKMANYKNKYKNIEVQLIGNKPKNNKVTRLFQKVAKLNKLVIENPKNIINPDFYRKIDNRIKCIDFSLIIFDDLFPSLASPFRNAEFSNYLKSYLNVYVASTGCSLPLVEKNKKMGDLIKEFEEKNSDYKNKIFDISLKSIYRDENLKKIEQLKHKIAIICFENNVIDDNYNVLHLLEKYNIPFIFTLYPGGGFVLNDEKSDNKLRKIFASNCFKRVIVTQELTKKYLIDNKFCDESKIQFIYGIATPSEMLKINTLGKKSFRKNKKILDVAFVAHKYTKQGIDKGYDLFIDAAKKLIKKNNNIRFNVVGEFNEKDIDVKILKDKIKFYGTLNTESMINFYKNMDIIVSPTRPFILSKGSFDGFPTQYSTDAMLNKVVLITTDELKLNNLFINNSELYIIKPDSKEIVDKINYLYNHPKELNSVALNGQKKARKIYSIKNQLKKRNQLINEVVNETYKRS